MATETKKTKQILFIEDDVGSRTLLCDYLEAHGYKVTAFEDGLSGMAAAAEHEYDFVILDLRLPGQNGFVVAQEIKRLHPQVPIIVTSAFADQAHKLKSYQAGANFFLSKPLDLHELLLLLQNYQRTE
jgi:DNA-binding response OmpR family regulator